MRLGHGAAVGLVVIAAMAPRTLAGCSHFDAGPASNAADAAGTASNATDAAGIDAADGASRPCASAHVFCDDFDDGNNDPSTRWDTITFGAGPIALDTSDSVSAPRSLRVILSSGSGSRATTIEKRVVTTKGHVTVGFDFRVETPSSQDFGAMDFATIGLLPPPTGSTGHDVTLFQYKDSPARISYSHTPDDGTDTKSDLDPNIAFGRWQRITFQITSGATPKVSIWVDGVLSGAVSISAVALTGVVIRLGVDTAEALTTTTVHYDNVTVDEE